MERQKKQVSISSQDRSLRLLTGDEFHNQVVQVEHQKAADDEKIQVECENRRKLKEAQLGVMTAWKEIDEARKQRDKVKRCLP